MKKKLVYALLVVVVAAQLIGCTKKSDSSKEKTSEPAKVTEE